QIPFPPWMYWADRILAHNASSYFLVQGDFTEDHIWVPYSRFIFGLPQEFHVSRRRIPTPDGRSADYDAYARRGCRALCFSFQLPWIERTGGRRHATQDV